MRNHYRLYLLTAPMRRSEPGIAPHAPRVERQQSAPGRQLDGQASWSCHTTLWTPWRRAGAARSWSAASAKRSVIRQDRASHRASAGRQHCAHLARVRRDLLFVRPLPPSCCVRAGRRGAGAQAHTGSFPSRRLFQTIFALPEPPSALQFQTSC
eukprot:712597-Rhodomonas_salina.2